MLPLETRTSFPPRSIPSAHFGLKKRLTGLRKWIKACPNAHSCPCRGTSSANQCLAQASYFFHEAAHRRRPGTGWHADPGPRCAQPVTRQYRSAQRRVVHRRLHVLPGRLQCARLGGRVFSGRGRRLLIVWHLCWHQGLHVNAVQR